MGEAVGHHAALDLLLNGIVANGIGGLQRLFDVAVIELDLGSASPHPSKTIRLELLANREDVRFSLARRPRLETPHLIRDTGHGLDVVPHLVGDHIGLSEVTRCPETPGQ